MPDRAYLDERDDLDTRAIRKGESRNGRDDTRSGRHYRACLESARDQLSYHEHLETLESDLLAYADEARGQGTKGEHDFKKACVEVTKISAGVIERFTALSDEQHETILHAYRNTAPENIPPRDFLFGPAYIRGFVSALVAPGGAAKTSLTITEALSMASGRDLLNIDEDGEPAKLPRALNVCVWNLEDDVDSQRRRFILRVR